MSKNRILILGASYYQLDAIRAAERCGYTVLTSDNRPANPGHRLADFSFNVDTTDENGILELARREKINGITAPATDAALPALAYVAESLNIPGPSAASVDILCNKINFRNYLSRLRYPVPEHYIPGNTLPGQVDFDGGATWILKPTVSSGSKGIFILKSKEDFYNYLPETISFSQNGSVIIERFIEGIQGTAEGIVENGKIVFSLVLDRQTAGFPHTTTVGQRFPSRLSKVKQTELIKLIELLWISLGIKSTLFDCDFILADDKFYILEMAPRLGGNSICRLVKRATGLDLTEYAVRLSCSDTPPLLPEAAPEPTAIVLLGVEQAGSLTFNRKQLEQLKSEPWLQHLSIDVPEGTRVSVFKNGRERLGEALITASSRDELDQRASELDERLDLRAE